MPEKELPLGKGRRPELAETASPMNTNGHEWEGKGEWEVEGPSGWRLRGWGGLNRRLVGGGSEF
jgi:hypothetical protein